MTKLLFRDDGYLRSCAARVVGADGRGIRLDRTVFYPMGGGQPGDTGVLRRADGTEIAITDTRKGEAPGEIVHVPAEPVATHSAEADELPTIWGSDTIKP